MVKSGECCAFSIAGPTTVLFSQPKGGRPMSSVSDIIEHYLKQILDETTADFIEIKRSELAEIFQCVPSQINYVIGTRFTAEKGYVVESKRGGAGFIRIQKIPLYTKQQDLEELLSTVSSSITQVMGEHVILRLLEEELMTDREALLMQRMIARETLRISVPLRDEVRARMMRVLITTLFTS